METLLRVWSDSEGGREGCTVGGDSMMQGGSGGTTTGLMLMVPQNRG
jgi:hypothetical protein